MGMLNYFKINCQCQERINLSVQLDVSSELQSTDIASSYGSYLLNATLKILQHLGGSIKALCRHYKAEIVSSSTM